MHLPSIAYYSPDKRHGSRKNVSPWQPLDFLHETKPRSVKGTTPH